VTAWPAHEDTFDSLDVAVLRIEDVSPEVSAPTAFDAARSGEILQVATTEAIHRGQVMVDENSGKAILRMASTFWSGSLQGASGAPVWRPSTGEVIGMITGRHGTDVTVALAFLPARVIHRAILDYLTLPVSGGVERASEAGRHVGSAASPGMGASLLDKTQFIPLNDIERRMIGLTESDGGTLLEVLRNAEVWVPSVAPGTNLRDAVQEFEQGGTEPSGTLVLVTAAQRAFTPCAGPWPVVDVVGQCRNSTELSINPDTPIHVMLPVLAARELWTQLAGLRDQGGRGWIGESEPRARGRRFLRRRLRWGYAPDEVDDFAERIEQGLRRYAAGTARSPLVTSSEVETVTFKVRLNGYDYWQV
ncbi:hypothetical protein AB0N23_32115, partial [Streptomyces sp. NPDC052644]